MNMKQMAVTKNRFSVINSEEAKIIDSINDSLMWGAMDFFRENGFKWIEVPTLTKITGACENVDTLYPVNHFGTEAYLAQTGQLYLEAKIPLHEKLWTVITSSRAEDKADKRHLNQFQLVEMEHQGSLQDLLEEIEGLIKSMLKEVCVKSEAELKKLGTYDEVLRWSTEPFARITYTDAIEILQGQGYEIQWGDDLTSKEEMVLIDEAGCRPLFVSHFPKAIKFFNMRQNDDNPRVVNSCDLIMPYSGESVGAAERENDHERLVARLKESQMFKVLAARGKTVDDFQDYLDMVKHNPILHSGCGVGFGRVSQSVQGSRDIRTSTNFPIQCDRLY